MQLKQTSFIRTEAEHASDLDLSKINWQGASTFKERRKFLKNLSGLSKDLFDELLSCSITEARIVHRYFCLSPGDEPISQNEAGLLFGYETKGSDQICSKISAVLYYLGYSTNLSKRAVRTVELIQQKISAKRNEKTREKGEKARNKALLKGTGLREMPEIPSWLKREEFEEMCGHCSSGRLTLLEDHSPEQYAAVNLRFGFEDGHIHSFSDIAEEFEVSKQAIQDRMRGAFDFLRKSRPV